MRPRSPASVRAASVRAPCGRPATHVLDGLCAKCWAKNDQELKRRAQAQSTNKGRQLAELLGQALSPAHWRELWDKVKHSRWRTTAQQEQARLALQQAEAEFLS
jgi:hypothetical protein